MRPKVESFYSLTRAARKIMVVDLGFLGDSIHLIPALHEIKRHYPEAQLHTLSATVGAELLNLVPCVDSAWAFPLTEKSPKWWRHWDIIKSIRREKFDVAVNFSGADRAVIVTGLTGAKWRLAVEGTRRHFWSRWMAPMQAPRQSQEIQVFEQRMQVLAAAGFTLEPPRFEIRVPEKARESAAMNIPANSVHFSVNASQVRKEWPLENWIDLAKMILESDPDVQLVATASEKPRELERLHRLAEAVPNARLLCLDGLTIGQLAALLQRCRLHFGADSGIEGMDRTRVSEQICRRQLPVHRRWQGSVHLEGPGRVPGVHQPHAGVRGEPVAAADFNEKSEDLNALRRFQFAFHFGGNPQGCPGPPGLFHLFLTAA
jgi:ADP-heptose:LPS heptosyltransferase